MLLLEPYNPNWKQVTEKKASIFYHERPNSEKYKTDGLSLEKKTIRTSHFISPKSSRVKMGTIFSKKVVF